MKFLIRLLGGKIFFFMLLVFLFIILTPSWRWSEPQRTIFSFPFFHTICRLSFHRWIREENFACLYSSGEKFFSLHRTHLIRSEFKWHDREQPHNNSQLSLTMTQYDDMKIIQKKIEFQLSFYLWVDGNFNINCKTFFITTINHRLKSEKTRFSLISSEYLNERCDGMLSSCSFEDGKNSFADWNFLFCSSLVSFL